MPVSHHHVVQSGPRLDRRRLLAASAALLAGLPLFKAGSASRQGHSVAGSSGAGPASLVAMLGNVPAGDAVISGGFTWVYTDFATQLAWHGIPMPSDPGTLPDGYAAVQFPLAIWSDLFRYLLDEEFIEAIGFFPGVIERVITVGAPPSLVSVHQGTFDEGPMSAAWEASGYETVESASGIPIRAFPNADLDLENPIQRRVISSMNAVALVDDLFITAGNVEVMERVLDTIVGSGQSIAEVDASMQAVALLPDTIVSAVGIDPREMFAGVDTESEAFEESDAAVGPMPSLDAIVSGVTAGLRALPRDESTPIASPDASLGEGQGRILLVAGSDEDAAQAARVAEHRWTTSQSVNVQVDLNDLMTLQSAEAEGAVASLSFTIPGPQRVWHDIFTNRDAFAFTPNPS